MVIKLSSAKHVDALVADLASSSPIARESAAARLMVLGGRAVHRLAAFAKSDAVPAARAAALRTLEAIGDPRGLDTALLFIDDADPTLALAGVSAVRGFVRSRRGALVVDRLTTVALDAARGEAVRLAALRGLEVLERSTVGPLLQALRDDANEAVRLEARRAQLTQGAVAADPAEDVARAAEHGLPEDPGGLAAALAITGGPGSTIPLAQLHKLVERIREREPMEPPSRRSDWTRLRGTIHVALAGRRSRVALYDLRESLEGAASPLPVEFLTALSKIGDASCLEAIAGAYAHAAGVARNSSPARDWWHQHLADAFHAIATRERLTRRHAVMKKIEKRWPEILG